MQDQLQELRTALPERAGGRKTSPVALARVHGLSSQGRFNEAKAALASAWKQYGQSIGEAVLRQEVDDLRWRMGLPQLSECSMGPEDWLGAQDLGSRFDMRVMLATVATASGLAALLLTYTWTRPEQSEDPAPDWPQGSPGARSDGVWTLQPQWQEPLEENSQSSRSRDEVETDAFETGPGPSLDSFLGEEFEPLAIEHVPATPEASPSQSVTAVGVLVPPMQLPLSAASTPTLRLEPAVSAGLAVPLPLNHLLPLPDSRAPCPRGPSSRSEEYLDLDTSLARSFPATPEWSDWSNVWFAGPEGPRRAFTESQLIPGMANFPDLAMGWPQARHIAQQAQHAHEPVEARRVLLNSKPKPGLFFFADTSVQTTV